MATVHSSRVRSKSDIAALAAATPLIDHLIAPSEAIAAKLRREGRGSAPRSRVIPNGVDLHRFGARRSPEDRAATRASLGIPADAFLIGVVARLEPEKGHRYLLAAWPEIAQAVPNAWLLLVGDGSLTDALRAQTRALPRAARRRVVFAGGQTDVVALTQSLDLAVLPSLREAQGIALLEAMAARVPVVASRVGGIPETIRDGVDGLLVPPPSPQRWPRPSSAWHGTRRSANGSRPPAGAAWRIGSAWTNRSGGSRRSISTSSTVRRTPGCTCRLAPVRSYDSPRGFAGQTPSGVQAFWPGGWRT